MREFDKASDNFYVASRALENAEEDILNKISLNRMKMDIDIDKIKNGEKVEGKSLVPKEFSDYKDYLIDEDSAFNFIFSKVLKLIKCNKVYSGDEIDDLPKKIAYKKDGFLYVYELKETPQYNFFGTDFYGDFGYEYLEDKELVKAKKLYKFEKIYSTEPELKIGIVPTGGFSNLKVNNMSEFFKSNFGEGIKNSVTKTKNQFQGQNIYEVTKKIDNPYLKKGDKFYLDNLHKDHIEVFDKRGNVRAVLNLDGTLNEMKTKNAIGRKLK